LDNSRQYNEIVQLVVVLGPMGGHAFKSDCSPCSSPESEQLFLLESGSASALCCRERRTETMALEVNANLTVMRKP
jgi:hypothetical protein